MTVVMKKMLLILSFALASNVGFAQGYVDQTAVAPLLQTQNAGPAPKPVGWHVYKFPKSAKTAKAQLAALQNHIDSIPGNLTQNRLEVVELSNRVTQKYLRQKSEVIVPDEFVADFRAYSPYPSYWSEAATSPKIFIIDKYSQTFAAYEHGNLVRWGLVSTGKDATETPAGRFAFSWKDALRNSSEAPAGETWEMRWVFNFYPERGIHVHQYSLPIAQPVSHGCVRMAESEAKWNYDWAEKGTPVLVINYNPFGLASHWQVSGTSVFSGIMMPVTPEEVPAGGGKVAVRD